MNGIHEVTGSNPVSSTKVFKWAGIAQVVEHKLPKLGVAGSSPVARSKEGQRHVAQGESATLTR